jgi:hypothetical protein
MCIGIHSSKHERVGKSFVVIRRSDSKLVPVSPEVNVSLHYARKSHDRHIAVV